MLKLQELKKRAAEALNAALWRLRSEKWFAAHHGMGEPHQFRLYRCSECKGIVTHRMIAAGGCGCPGSRLRPTNPTLGESFRLMVAPWPR